MEKNEKISIIKSALDKIRPYLIQDDGDVEFLNLTENDVVELRFLGNCKKCKFKEQTKNSILKHIQKYYHAHNIVEVD